MRGAGTPQLWAGVVVAGLLAAGCTGDGEPGPVSQDEYMEAALAFSQQQEQYAGDVVACAAAEGVEAVTTWDHGVFLPPDVDPAEAQDDMAVISACAEETYPPPREPTAEDVREQYALLLAARECLLAEGFEVSEPSSLDEFVEAYESGGTELPWTPFTDLLRDMETFRAGVEACPQPGRY